MREQLFGYFADKIGALNSFTLSVGASAVLIFGWMGVASKGGVVVFAVLYGFFAAGIQTLGATVVAMQLCPDMREYGTRIAMLLLPAATGLLIGNPNAGAILPTG